MKVYIASSKKYVNKVEEDIYICKKYNDLNIETKIETIENIVKKVKPKDVVILKSIWGYYKNSNLFLKQIKNLQRKKVKLINDYKFVYWNIEKIKYLRDIKSLDIVPTYSLRISKLKTKEKLEIFLKNKITKMNMSEIVIKPSIGESGYLTKKFNLNIKNEYNNLIKFILINKNKDFILQPFIKTISKGEISIIIIKGIPLYGIRRYPGILSKKEDTLYLERDKLSKDIINKSKNINSFLNKKFKSIPDICRIDFIETENSLKILEIELIDPDLFFRKVSDNIKEKVFLRFKLYDIIKKYE